MHIYCHQKKCLTKGGGWIFIFRFKRKRKKWITFIFCDIFWSLKESVGNTFCYCFRTLKESLNASKKITLTVSDLFGRPERRNLYTFVVLASNKRCLYKNREPINPHLPSNLTCFHIVPAITGNTNKHDYLSLLRHLHFWHPEPKHLDICLNSLHVFQVWHCVRIIIDTEYFLRARIRLNI